LLIVANQKQKGRFGMPNPEWSVIGGGQQRCTIHNTNGSTITVDSRADGGITVTDVDSAGKSVSGEGAKGICGMSDAVRLNNTPGKL
jgi:hypothetical protein